MELSRAAARLRLGALLCAAIPTLSGCIVSRAIPTWPAGPQGHLVLDAAQGFIVAAEIDGHPVRLRVETGYSGVILNPGVAAAIQLKPSGFRTDIRIGPTRVRGSTTVGTLSTGGASAERRILWFERDIAADADGIINVASLPNETVTLRLHAPQPGERPVTLQTNPDGFWSLVLPHRVGNETIGVRFVLDTPRTLVTAAAGALLAEQNGGTWSGEPFLHPLPLGVRRPVRPMTFSRPIDLGGLSLRQALIRTADFGGRYALPADGPPDPDEVLVTGKRAPSPAYLIVILGRDRLEACSTLTYAAPTRLLTLQCRP